MKSPAAAIVWLILFFPSVAVCQDSSYHLLNYKERLDYARNGQFPTARTIIKDSTGSILDGFNLLWPVIDDELYSASDYYVDHQGKIMEVVIRKSRAADRELIKRVYDLDEEQLRGSMNPIKADCAHEREILAGVLLKEEENRKNEQVIDVELDNVQEATVVALLKQCAAPTLATVGVEGVRAIFFVLQHARRKNQEKYFSVLQDFLRDGNLRKGATASIEDRLLMTGGLKQRYGTQIVFFVRSGYHLFPIEDRDHVDERRGAIGLPPLELYLKEREEFYGTEVK
jgi:hypothetical protein